MSATSTSSSGLLTVARGERALPRMPFMTFVEGIESVDPREALLLRLRIAATWQQLDGLGWTSEARDAFEQTVSDAQLARVLPGIENDALDRVDALPEHRPAAEGDGWLARSSSTTLDTLPREGVRAAATTASGA